MRDPACKRGPASIRSFTVYEMNTRQRTKGGTLSTLQYNFSNFGAIVVQFWCILSYIRLLKQSKNFLGMGDWGGGGPSKYAPDSVTHKITASMSLFTVSVLIKMQISSDGWYNLNSATQSVTPSGVALPSWSLLWTGWLSVSFRYRIHRIWQSHHCTHPKHTSYPITVTTVMKLMN